MARANVLVARGAASNSSGAGTSYVVRSIAGHYYCVYNQNSDNDLFFTKSTDGGFSWSTPTSIATGTMSAVSVWYDRWSGIAAGLIHIAYTESGVDDVLYRTINTESSDTLSTATVVFAGATVVLASGALSITRARGGNVGCIFDIDGGTEQGFAVLANANVPNGAWASKTSGAEAAGAGDFYILMPGWAADNQDLMMFYWDASADEISRKLYDDSANSWAETSIAGTMVELVQGTGFGQFAAAVDTTNSRNLLVAWSAADLANADLRCWHVTESAITEVTNVVLNSTDDQGLCAIGIDDNEDWYVFYAGASGGAEVFNTDMVIYYKVSTDDGVTWGAETPLTAALSNAAQHLCCLPRFQRGEFALRYQNSTQFIAMNVQVPTLLPKPTFVIGLGL